jgi:hypothetical protein
MRSITSADSGKFLKLFTLLFFFLIGVNQSRAQKEVKDQTYTIVDNGSVTDIQPYINALNNSEMKNHRLLNTRYTIVFQSGLKVELFSATEISNKGLSINLSEYPESFASSRRDPVFALGANDFIIEYHTSGSKHH